MCTPEPWFPSSGKAVLNAGELSDFSRLLTEQVQQTFGTEIKNKQQFIEAASQIDFEKLGNDYLASINAQFAHLGLGKNIHYFSDRIELNGIYMNVSPEFNYRLYRLLVRLKTMSYL